MPPFSRRRALRFATMGAAGIASAAAIPMAVDAASRRSEEPAELRSLATLEAVNEKLELGSTTARQTLVSYTPALTQIDGARGIGIHCNFRILNATGATQRLTIEFQKAGADMHQVDWTIPAATSWVPHYLDVEIVTQNGVVTGEAHKPIELYGNLDGAPVYGVPSPDLYPGQALRIAITKQSNHPDFRVVRDRYRIFEVG